MTLTDARLRDLVRHQRGELHDAGLLTDEEYAALAADPGAVARLEGYDAMRADLATCRKALINAGNAAGAHLSESCSTAFLALVADEVRLVVRRLTEERDIALARVRELEAALANERGEGAPPSEGWIAREDSDGPRWNRETVTDRSNHIDLCVWIELTLADRRGIHPWAWAVMVAPDADSDMVEAAYGTAPTAREAMRAADTALRGGGQ